MVQLGQGQGESPNVAHVGVYTIGNDWVYWGGESGVYKKIIDNIFSVFSNNLFSVNTTDAIVTYTGTKTRRFFFILNLNLEPLGLDPGITHNSWIFQIYKNGVAVASTKKESQSFEEDEECFIGGTGIIELAKDDYLEFYMTTETGADIEGRVADFNFILEALD